MKNLNAPENWLSWLRACLGDPGSPIDLPRPKQTNQGPRRRERPTAVLGMLTGQDCKALAAVAACWALYAGSDNDGREAAIISIRALLLGMQAQCRMFARELIAQQMEWSDRARLWPVVQTKGPTPADALTVDLPARPALFLVQHRRAGFKEVDTKPGEMVGGAALTHGQSLRRVSLSGTPPATWLCNSCLAVVPGTPDIAQRDGTPDPARCPECNDNVLCACPDCLELVPVVEGWPTMAERVRACHSAGYGFKLSKVQP